MKKAFASFLLALTLIFTPAQKSEAVVGGLASLVVAAPAVIVAGALISATGGVLLFVSGKDGICGGEDCKWTTGFLGLFMVPLGLLVLDGEQTLAFSEVSPGMEHLKGISASEIEIYNSELDELNAINTQITDEVTADRSVDAKALWNEMGTLLSPATLKIASLNSQLLMRSIKK